MDEENEKYYFDKQAADDVCAFFENYLVHSKGEWAGKPFILEEWERDFLRKLFGFKRKSDSLRQYRRAYLEIPRKNGKSTLAAGIAIYLTFADREPGAEVYSAATTKDQAKIVFKEYARAMVVKNPELQEIFKTYAHSIVDAEAETSSFLAVASDVDQLDGKNVHCAIIDEYHAHKTDGVFRIMVDGMSSRPQPMTIIITTAGFDPDVPCVAEEEYAQRILAGKAKNETYFAIIYTLDKKDRWDDKTKWIKANPCLGVSKQLKAMEADFQKALDMPAEQSKFKNKNLNIWTKNQTGWLKDGDWEKVETVFDLEEMKGAPCFAGIDLSTVQDTSAKALCFRWNDKFRLYTKIYLPDHDLRERELRERFEWQQMADGGHCILTSLRSVDYDFIQADLEKDLKMFDIQGSAYDPFNSSQFINNLETLGLGEKLIEFPQNWKYIDPATKDLETKIINGQIEAYKNPVITWMVSNTVMKLDSNGNKRPTKTSPTKHIDGVIAMIMALDQAVRNPVVASVYETRGPLVL